MKIATWNLERPPSGRSDRKARAIELMKSIKAEIWALTETHESVQLDGYSAAFSMPVRGYHHAGECYSAILSSWPIARRLDTFSAEFAVCVEVAAPFGPCLVYSTIITYANDKGPTGLSKRWAEHRLSVRRHIDDWRRLRAAFPDHSMIVAGDFNQSRDGSGWYEDVEAVATLSEGLKTCALECLTAFDFRRSGLLQKRATIDHICLSNNLSRLNPIVGAWEGADANGKMSDHNGVWVELRSDS